MFIHGFLPELKSCMLTWVYMVPKPRQQPATQQLWDIRFKKNDLSHKKDTLHKKTNEN